MLLDAAPQFDNRLTLGTIVQVLAYAVTAAIVLLKTVWRTSTDSDTLKTLAEAQKNQSNTQAQLTTTQALQQNIIENLKDANEAAELRAERAHSEHKERMDKMERNYDHRVSRLEEHVFLRKREP